MNFAIRLRELRNTAKLTQQQLGDQLNLRGSAISKYESGDSQPSFPTLIKISKIFNVSIDYLLGVSNMQNPYSTANLNVEEIEMIHRYRKLTKENQIRLDERYAVIYEDQQKYQLSNKS